ncbi:unnamed protein product [Sphenostylis stenocarpa]|uniref:Uncharacterized protein n=1 Tax=Sphenostylis stenocarpa TaxID=92480 RepID=A0AA86SEP4_9FABA|nr:unnamed protein product [Sphenostylis stenocarpa]
MLYKVVTSSSSKAAASIWWQDMRQRRKYAEGTRVCEEKSQRICWCPVTYEVHDEKMGAGRKTQKHDKTKTEFVWTTCKPKSFNSPTTI